MNSRKLPPYVPPSPYVPFFRRFTDERALDLAETAALHRDVQRAFKKSPWSSEKALPAAIRVIRDRVEEQIDIPAPAPSCREALLLCLAQILMAEEHIFDFPDIDWNGAVLSLKDHVALRRRLRAQQHFLANDQAADELASTLVAVFAGILENLSLPGTGIAVGAVPLHTYLDVRDVVDRIIGTIATERLADLGLFAGLADQMYRNVCAASKLVPYQDHNRPFVTARDADLAPSQLIDTYLGETPFQEFLQTPVPFRIPIRSFQAHGIILAPPEHGKTQLLGSFIRRFLDEDVGLLVLDPHGDLFASLKTRTPADRTILLDPSTDPPPLNFFDFGNASDVQVLQTFSYLMSSLSGGLSDKQGAIVPYLLKLLRLIPHASIETLRDIIDEKPKRADQSKFADVIGRLPATDQGFFQSQFYSGRMQETKDAIGWKLYACLASDAFRKMFAAKTNSFDAAAAMRERKIVLVKGSENVLGEQGLPVFLQFIIAQYFLAALKRDAIPQSERHLCLVFADEASHVFNHQTTRILTECRKYGLGFFAATQLIEQIPAEVKAAIYGATAIKIAGPVSYTDASLLAREMHATPEFIRSLRSHRGSHAEWALSVANLTHDAVKIAVPFGQIENLPEHDPPTTKWVRESDETPSPPPSTPPPLPRSRQTPR